MPKTRNVLSIAGLVLEIIDDAGEPSLWLTETCRAFHAASETPATSTLLVHRHPQFRRSAQENLMYQLGPEPGSFHLEGMDFIAERRRCGLPITIDAHPDTGLAGVLRWISSLLLLEQGGALLHAASFAYEGSGIVCAGPSGSGKTTLARLLQSQADVAVFSDESTACRFLGDLPMIYATPFAGELGPISGPAAAPLETICFLRHAPQTALRPLAPAEIVARLLGTTFLAVRDGAWLESCFTIAERIARTVACYELGFRPEPAVWEAIRHVLAAPVSSS